MAKSEKRYNTQAAVLKRHKVRQARYDFCRMRLKKILSLSMQGWPRMTLNKDFLKWLDLVYEAKGKGLYSVKTSNCDVIANLYHKAKELNNHKNNQNEKNNH